MAKRKIRPISKLQPLQRDTVHLIPNSYIKGGFEKSIDLIGTAFSGLITVERQSEDVPVLGGTYRFTCTDTGKFTVTNLSTGTVSSEYDASSADVTVNDIYNHKVTVKSGLTGVAADDICDVYIAGDSTYIIPGTILGRIKDDKSDNFGKYEPIAADLTKYDVLRVCGGTVETNMSNYTTPISNTMVNMDNYITDVYIFAQVIEEVCRAINLTDEAKAMIQGIVWE